jgi:hypothetical protein
VCQHDKRVAIDAALRVGLPSAVIAGKFHVAKKLIELHEQHRMSPSGSPRAVTPDDPAHEAMAASSTPHDPIRRVKQHMDAAARAWRDVDEDRRTAERLQMIVQEAFASDDMGLP